MLKMADLKEDKIDFSKLEKELSSAMESDASYWRENDAKIRAMEQRVETYDQFRDMVAAAHIKPLDKKDKIGKGKRNQPWNPFSSSNSTSASTTSPDTHEGTKSTNTKVNIPKNGHEFTMEWRIRKKSPGSCYVYLTDLGGETLAKIFKSEISFALLGEIITVLNGGVREEHGGKVADILMCLTRAGRFNLSLDFLSKAEKEILSELMEKLERSRHWDSSTREDDDEDEGKGEPGVKTEDSGKERLEGDENDENKQEEVDEGNAGDNCRLSVSEEVIAKLKELYKLLDK